MSEDTRGLYERLAAEFKQTFTLPGKRGSDGEPLQYITGEQCITRLNDVLTFQGWAFEVLGHGQLGDDFWVQGRLTLHTLDGPLVKEQFGSMTSNRGMAPGDTLKGAATDCLKKCATLIGVGLYLSHKEEAAEMAAPASAPRAPLIAFEGRDTTERSAAFLNRCKNELGIDSGGIEALLGEKVSTRMRRTNEGLEQIYLVLKAKWEETA